MGPSLCALEALVRGFLHGSEGLVSLSGPLLTQIQNRSRLLETYSFSVSNETLFFLLESKGKRINQTLDFSSGVYKS